ncbi:MAG: A/G-specific adenine glycosylase [bacterium]|nr:A/G-specific adenine glycosylase [bacterium]
MTTKPDDAALTRALEAWFRASARDLPWRTDYRDPYRSLVSELMLQQTQVSRVLEKFGAFLERFPTVEALASAPEDEVLAAWSGLGYYRRARLLHACAKAIVEYHAGKVPESVEELLELPGIGRYTAGAIASMVFGQRAPIVDGNVTRVLLRVHNKPVPQAEKATVDWAWQRAEELVNACEDPAVFNEAMMELGATVCVPKGPKCLQCPISDRCGALAAGTIESIPLPKPKAKQKHLYCASVVVRDGDTLHLEQRPSSGMWAGMYQLPTLERDDRAHKTDDLKAAGIAGAEHIDSFTHITTHRIVEFAVYRAPRPARTPENWAKHAIGSLDRLAISNAQVKALRIAGILES